MELSLHTASGPRSLRRLLGLGAPVAVLAGFASPALAQTPSFTLIGWPADFGPNGQGYVTGLSADGRSASGYTIGGGLRPGFMWTANGGRNDFGRVVGPTVATYGDGISGDGLTVVGRGDSTTISHAYTWSQSGGYTDLGTMSGYLYSGARDANFDGSVVVGTLSNGVGSTPQAFRWTPGGGMQGLGVGTRAAAVSGNGSVIVGGTGPVGNRPFTWTSSNGLQFLPTLDGTTSGSANGVNGDGSRVIGESGVEFRGTLWVNGVPLDLTNGSTTANLSPNALSDDGSVVVGQLNLGQGGLTAGVWTQATGMIALSDYLTANGVSIPAGFGLFTCSAVSADGMSFSGWGNGPGPNTYGWVTTIPAPGVLGVLGLGGLLAARRRR